MIGDENLCYQKKKVDKDETVIFVMFGFCRPAWIVAGMSSSSSSS